MKRLFLFVSALALIAGSYSFFPSNPAVASDPGSNDWPMWGGSPDRNMVSNAKNMPVKWDVKTGENVKWAAALGSQSYGNTVVGGGQVYIGTNNEGLRDPKQPR